MKGFLAAALAHVPSLASGGPLSTPATPPLAHPLHLALSYDEEVGCLGAPRLIEDLIAAGLTPAMAIVGEPTGMQLARTHKSVNLFETEVHGLEAHSSQPHLGAGAILAAGRLLAFLWEEGVRARTRSGGEGAAFPDPITRAFEPPWTTVQAGLIDGGTAANILPGRCRFSWEYRTLPGEDADGILQAMNTFARENVLPDLQATAPAARITTRVLARVPALQPERDHAPVVRIVRSLLSESSPRPTLPEGTHGTAYTAYTAGTAGTEGVSYGTEGGQFQGAGIPTVLCGPGSIDVAHRPNEFLEIDQLARCSRFIGAMITRCRNPEALSTPG